VEREDNAAGGEKWERAAKYGFGSDLVRRFKPSSPIADVLADAWTKIATAVSFAETHTPRLTYAQLNRLSKWAQKVRFLSLSLILILKTRR
jgi:hypothetical protein